VALAAGCASRTGQQRSGDLEVRIQDTVGAVDSYGASRAAALDSMNMLIGEPLENLEAKFETFNTCVDRVVTSDRSLRGCVDAMKTSANARYRAWGEDNIAYADEDMQVRSQESRAEATASFRAIEKDSEAMLDQSTGFVTYLVDFRRVLSNDLSRKGVTGVRDFARKALASDGELEDLARALRKKLGAAAESMGAVASTN
jgi:hypothetical protein